MKQIKEANVGRGEKGEEGSLLQEAPGSGGRRLDLEGALGALRIEE